MKKSQEELETVETFDRLCEILAGEMLLAIGRGTPARTIVVSQAMHILTWKDRKDRQGKKVS